MSVEPDHPYISAAWQNPIEIPSWLKLFILEIDKGSFRTKSRKCPVDKFYTDSVNMPC